MIDDISTYSISDFILFSKEVLFAVYLKYNKEIWPYQFLCLFLSVGLLRLIRTDSVTRGRLASLILAGVWAWIGWVFHLKYFLPINWATQYFAWLFIAQAALVAGIGVVGGGLRFGQTGLWRALGLAAFMFSAFIPVEYFLDGNWSRVLMFGWGADRTAIGTLGLLMLSKGSALRWLLVPLPILWCLVAGLTYYGLR